MVCMSDLFMFCDFVQIVCLSDLFLCCDCMYDLVFRWCAQMIACLTCSCFVTLCSDGEPI